MLFNSLHFAGFFLVVLTLVAVLSRKLRARNIVLLICGYYFYGWWDWRFLFLLAFTTLVDYLCGRAILIKNWAPGQTVHRTPRDRVFLIVSLGVNLGALAFFKYFNFFIESAEIFLDRFGLHAHLPTLRVILPVGISFYTFQSMSYIIDVYRGLIPGERSLLDYATFVAFFPPLVAGPIERASHLLPQMKRPNLITWDGLQSGFYLIVWGLFKKVVIADNVAAVADAVFREFPNAFASGQHITSMPPSGSVLLGIYAFAIQIYCDFSGYTDLARGTARMMGFELVRNFNLPYFAVNPSDFWQRWHISLSTWLRDYLYIPLGGNRKGRLRTYVNLMLTMLLGGLWHGAAWTFVIWGAYHGALLCAHHLTRDWLARNIVPKSRAGESGWKVIRVVIFFHLVCIGWLLFRAESFEQAWLMFRSLARLSFRWELVAELKLTLLVCAMILLVVQLLQMKTKEMLVAWRMPLPLRAVAYACVILGVIIFGQADGRAFIYFQF